MDIEIAKTELQNALDKAELRLTLAQAVDTLLTAFAERVDHHEYNTLVNNLDELAQEVQLLKGAHERAEQLRKQWDGELAARRELEQTADKAWAQVAAAERKLKELHEELSHRKQQLGAIALLVRS